MRSENEERRERAPRNGRDLEQGPPKGASSQSLTRYTGHVTTPCVRTPSGAAPVTAPVCMFRCLQCYHFAAEEKGSTHSTRDVHLIVNTIFDTPTQRYHEVPGTTCTLALMRETVTTFVMIGFDDELIEKVRQANFCLFIFGELEMMDIGKVFFEN